MKKYPADKDLGRCLHADTDQTSNTFACCVVFHARLVCRHFKLKLKKYIYFRNIIRVSNGLNRYQDRCSDLDQTVCKGYQQTTFVVGR